MLLTLDSVVPPWASEGFFQVLAISIFPRRGQQW